MYVILRDIERRMETYRVREGREGERDREREKEGERERKSI